MGGFFSSYFDSNGNLQSGTNPNASATTNPAAKAPAATSNVAAPSATGPAVPAGNDPATAALNGRSPMNPTTLQGGNNSPAATPYYNPLPAQNNFLGVGLGGVVTGAQPNGAATNGVNRTTGVNAQAPAITTASGLPVATNTSPNVLTQNGVTYYRTLTPNGLGFQYTTTNPNPVTDGGQGAAVSPYGANPYMSNPTFTNPNGIVQSLNPQFYATQDTANQVAKQYGGTVIATNPYTGGGGFSGNQAQYMVQLPNGQLINPGSIADLYNHGYSQSYIDSQVQQIMNGGTGQINGAPSSITGQSVPSNYNQMIATSGTNPAASSNQFYDPNSAASAQQLYAALTNSYSPLTASITNQTNPLESMLSSIYGLYGSDPFSTAMGGNSSLGSLLSNATSGGSMYDIANLLNALTSYRTNPTGVLSSLFWGQQSNPSNYSGLTSDYYPTLY